MKRKLLVFFLLLSIVITGCSSDGNVNENEVGNDEIKISDIDEKEPIEETEAEKETRIKKEAIEANFIDINGDKVEKDTLIHLTAKVGTVFDVNRFGEISVTTEEEGGYGMYLIENFGESIFPYNEGDIIDIWGPYNGKDDAGRPKIMGLIYEENKEVESSDGNDIKTVEEYKQLILPNLGEDDKLIDVDLQDRDITIKMELGSNDLIGGKELAAARYSSITDELLETGGNLNDITVIFEDIGTIKMNVKDKSTNEYGNYFDSLLIEESLE